MSRFYSSFLSSIISPSEICKYLGLPCNRFTLQLFSLISHLNSLSEIECLQKEYKHLDAGTFAANLIAELHISIKVKIQSPSEVFLRMYAPYQPFIVICNHPFGALDGLALLALLSVKTKGRIRLLANRLLVRIKPLQSMLIGVENSSDNHQNFHAVKETIQHLQSGGVIAMFPAGSVERMNWRGRIVEAPWQESSIRLIQRLSLPVLPIYFHGHNSLLFHFVGLMGGWRVRSLLLPRELLAKRGSRLLVSIGSPIMPEELRQYDSRIEQLTQFLRERCLQSAL